MIKVRTRRLSKGCCDCTSCVSETIHLYAHIQSVTLPQPDRAKATVFVAMAGVPIAAVQDLPALRADLHRFEIDFAREEKTWRVQRAAWRRAEPGEFLSP